MTYAVEHYPSGQSCAFWQPGDLLLTHNPASIWSLQGLVSGSIRFGQRRIYRHRNHNRAYCWTNHIAMAVDTTGILIESTAEGVLERHAEHYRNWPYMVVRTALGAHDRQRAVRFAYRRLGHSYDWGAVTCIGISALTRTRVLLVREGAYLCSGLAAAALEHAGVIFPVTGIAMMPADVAMFYGARP